jgi:hypothetical protein
MFYMSYILAPNKEMLMPLLTFCLRAHRFCLRSYLVLHGGEGAREKNEAEPGKSNAPIFFHRHSVSCRAQAPGRSRGTQIRYAIVQGM